MIVDCAIYDKGYRREGTHTLSEAADAVDHPGAFVWIGMYEPTESEFEEVGREFGLHELAIEDAIKAHQRPKLEIYGTSLFVVLKTARYIDESESVELGEIQVFVGEHFAVVVRHGEGSALAETRKRIEGREDLLALGPATVLYAVVDRVVDNYLPVVHGLEHDITQVEYQVFSNNDSHNPVERIYKLKREVLEMYGATAPLLEPLEQLASKELPCVPDETHDYFRDVHDHLVRVKDEIERFRELLTSVLEANLTRVSVRQNEDMRKISAWVAIAAVPTAVAGIYGMNFDHMPELGWTFGYPLALVIMGTACLLLYRAFRRSGWL